MTANILPYWSFAMYSLAVDCTHSDDNENRLQDGERLDSTTELFRSLYRSRIIRSHSDV